MQGSQPSATSWVLKLLLGLLMVTLVGCFKWDFWRSSKPTAKPNVPSASSNTLKKITTTSTGSEATISDKGLASMMRLMEQADAVHREVWRVVSEQSLPVTKTPFGKVYRALLSSQNKQLANKSFFLCDRYAVTKDILTPNTFPQRLAIYENCQKSTLKRQPFAQIAAQSSKNLKVVFAPSLLEEILGIGPAILNMSIECDLVGTDSGALKSLNCKSWAQNKDKQLMYSFDSYQFYADTAMLVRLKGKAHEDLREVRTLEVQIPLTGEIVVTETEMHAPEIIAPAPAEGVPTPAPQKLEFNDDVPKGLTKEQENEVREINRQAEEDIKAGRGKNKITPLPGSPGHTPLERYQETEQGLVPLDEAGEPLPQDPETGEYYQPEGSAVHEPGDDMNPVPETENGEANGDEVDIGPGAPGSGVSQGLPSPDLPPANGNNSPNNGSSEVDDAPIPPPRGR